MLATLLTLIFIRPLISSLAFPYENFIYSELLLIFLVIWIIKRRVLLKDADFIKYALLLFILAVFISVIFSKDKLASLKELYKYVTGILIFIVIVSLSPLEKKSRYFVYSGGRILNQPPCHLSIFFWIPASSQKCYAAGYLKFFHSGLYREPPAIFSVCHA